MKKRIIAIILTLAFAVALMLPGFAATRDRDVGVPLRMVTWQVYSGYTAMDWRLNVYVDNPANVGNNTNVTLYQDNLSPRDDSCYFRLMGKSSGDCTFQCKANSAYSVERYRPTNNCDVYLTASNTEADYKIHIAHETQGMFSGFYGITLSNPVGTRYMAMTATHEAVVGGYNVNWQYTDPNETNASQMWYPAANF